MVFSPHGVTMYDKQVAFRLASALALTVLIIAGGVQAQEFSLWGGLETGPYGVGFETIEKYDYSRAFRSSTDYFGEPQEGETARPIQICIWYPAQKTDGQIPMVYGEYAFPYPNNSDFFGVISTLQNREIQAVGFVFRGDQAALQSVMDLSVTAVRDAPHQDGEFPLIVYHTGIVSGYCQNATMCEYLASHGFIVATTHALGTNGVNVMPEPRDIESLIRDKEFAVAQLRDYPWLNHSSTGLLGYSVGAVGALVHRMRNADIDAVACMGGNYLTTDGAALVAENPSYNAVTMHVPLLQLYTAGEDTDLALMDSLVYSSRHLVAFSNPNVAAFSHYAVMSTLRPDTAGPDPQTLRRNYETSCRYVEQFFKAYLKSDEASLALLNAGPGDGATSEFRAAQPYPPTAGQFIQIIRNYGIERVIELDKQFGLSNPEHPILSGPRFTALGYGFLQSGRTDAAIEIFRMGAEAYPTSANAWDSYGEAHATNGDLKLAVECYKKALEILPLDENINPGLRDLIAANAPAIIEQLEQRIADEAGPGQ